MVPAGGNRFDVKGVIRFRAVGVVVFRGLRELQRFPERRRAFAGAHANHPHVAVLVQHLQAVYSVNTGFRTIRASSQRTGVCTCGKKAEQGSAKGKLHACTKKQI